MLFERDLECIVSCCNRSATRLKNTEPLLALVPDLLISWY